MMRPIPEWRRDDLTKAGAAVGLSTEQAWAAEAMGMSLREYAGYTNVRHTADVDQMALEERVRSEVRRQLLAKQLEGEIAAEVAGDAAAAKPARTERDPVDVEAVARRLNMTVAEYERFSKIQTIDDFRSS